MSDIRVRIAPSPSGFLHVGVARTAIFNWLYARHYKGTFILRIEDTDLERSSSEMVDSIINSLRWLGLDWDEGPYFQSERVGIHYRYLNRLLETGQAYRCFCTPDELEAKRDRARRAKADFKYDRTCLRLSPEEIDRKLEAGLPYVLRVQVPEGETVFEDMVYGRLTRNNADIEDFVVCRQDGTPLYNFVAVVDDHEMGITDIIRGNDHQTNTYKQVLLYNALGLASPRFAHLPLIFDERKKKISKRDEAANASDYGKEGFLPEAVVNYLALLGWSPKDDREIMTIDELIGAFDTRGINKSNAVFDIVKMRHINGEHIRRKSNHELATLVAPLLVQAEVATKYGLEVRWWYLMDVVGLLKDRCNFLRDFVERGHYFFQPPAAYEDKGIKKHFQAETTEWLERLADLFEKLEDFGQNALESALQGLAGELNLATGKLIHPTRLAVTGMVTGPGLYDILNLLGKKEVVQRMRRAAGYIRGKLSHE